MHSDYPRYIADSIGVRLFLDYHKLKELYNEVMGVSMHLKSARKLIRKNAKTRDAFVQYELCPISPSFIK